MPGTRAVATLLVVLLAGCGRGSAAAVAVDALAALRSPVTLHTWLGSHPRDVREHSPDIIGHACAIAASPLPLAGGVVAVRSAYFYVPWPDSALALPPDSTARTDDCVLGAVVVAVPAAHGDDAFAVQAARAMRRAFGADTTPFDASNWIEQKTAEWRAGEIALASGRQVRYTGHHGGGPGIVEDTVRVVGLLPISWQTDGLALGDLHAYDSTAHPVIGMTKAMDTECNTDVDSIIRMGEAAIASRGGGRALAQLHFLVADAYYHADGRGAERLPAARRHYREGLALDTAKTFVDRRRVLWNLWRLEAGLHPAGTVFITMCGDG